jgi:hypothetical protein
MTIASCTAQVLHADKADIRYLTPGLHAEMVSELRWPDDPCPDTGIDVRSLELDPGDLAVLDILRRPDVMAHLAQWNAGTALGEDTRLRVVASSAVAVILVPGGASTDCARRICRRGGMDYRTPAGVGCTTHLASLLVCPRCPGSHRIVNGLR